MNKKSVHNLAVSGLLGALGLLFTAYLHIPVGKGYIHIGDAFVYFGAVLLPMPYGILAGAGGAALADFMYRWIVKTLDNPPVFGIIFPKRITQKGGHR